MTAGGGWKGLMDEPRSAIGLGIVALLGVSAPTFALVVALAAFLIAVHALRRVNEVVDQIGRQVDAQSTELTELDPFGEDGDG